MLVSVTGHLVLFLILLVIALRQDPDLCYVLKFIKILNFIDCNVVRYNNKTYRIDDFDWDKRPDHSFKLRNDTTITIAEYYKKVSFGPTSPILSLCFITV